MTKTLSDEIRDCREGVVNNPYQGTDKRVVFVCSMGILRSATGARLYGKKYNTRTAGTWHDALVPLTPILMAWADELVFVNNSNYQMVMDAIEEDEMKAYIAKKSLVLDIPDKYPHMHPKLIQAFNDQYEQL